MTDPPFVFAYGSQLMADITVRRTAINRPERCLCSISITVMAFGDKTYMTCTSDEIVNSGVSLRVYVYQSGLLGGLSVVPLPGNGTR